jgi:predicted ATPase
MNEKILLNKDRHVVILYQDDWDDFGYKQTFLANIIKDQTLINYHQVKILFLNQEITQPAYSFIESKMADEQMFIDIEELNEPFISINSFYDEMINYFAPDEKKINEEIYKFSRLLKDLLYFESGIEHQNSFLSQEDYGVLKSKDAFIASLLRNQQIKRDKENGFINSIVGEIYDLKDCNFDISYKLNQVDYLLNFNFYNQVLSNPINIMIGKNGVGKTKSLEILVNYLLNPNPNTNDLIAEYNIDVPNHPNFINNLIVCSYNPFEKIPLITKDISIEYNYFGPRRTKLKKDGIPFEILGSITNDDEIKLLQYIFGSEFQQSDEHTAIEELKALFTNIDNHKIKEIIDKSGLFESNYVVDYKNYEELTKESFFNICKKDKEKSLYSTANKLYLFYINLQKYLDFAYIIGIKRLSDGVVIPIETYEDVYNNNLHTLNDTKLVVLDSDKNEIEHLSSGQKTFLQFIINIFSMIRPNSLIILDEPENTLHPTFEVDFIDLLKKVLNAYNSFAIIATHSATITREVPSHNIQILVRNEKTNEVEIQEPVINTYGASIGSINNYVFDDLFTKKRQIEEWLDKECATLSSYELFEEKYLDYISSELMQKAFRYYKSK